MLLPIFASSIISLTVILLKFFCSNSLLNAEKIAFLIFLLSTIHIYIAPVQLFKNVSYLTYGLIGGIFLVISFILMKSNIEVLIDPAWITVIICGIPLLYLAIWRVIHNPGISKISSALLITVAMFAAIAIGDLFAVGEVVFIMEIGAILEDMTTNRVKKGLKKLINQ